MKKKATWLMGLCGAGIVIMLCINILHLLKGDILFHADIARDFLVMDEMVETRRPTLIGPKSGGIMGVFHGPAWYYLNLPVFILTGGNPGAMGIWWMAMWVGSLGVGGYLIKKMWGGEIALLAVALWMGMTPFLARNMLQSTPAMFLAIPTLFCLSKYTHTKKARYLAGGVFLLGMIIQFQMALGVPMLLGVGLYLLCFVVKNKLWTHLGCFLIIVVPLSTFALFELRHDFLQTRSVARYLTEGDRDNREEFNLGKYLGLRGQALAEGFTLLPMSGEIWRVGSAIGAGVLIVMSGGWMIKMERENKTKKTDTALISARLGLVIIGSFWILTLPFRGELRGYYFNNLYPVVAMLAAIGIVKYRALKILAGGVIIVNVARMGILGGNYWREEATGNVARWNFYEVMMEDVLADAVGREVGYFAWTADQLGYSSKYAMKYGARKYGVKVFPYEKKAVTYLLMAPNEATYNADANPDYWRRVQVRLERAADKKWKYESENYEGDGFRVERYDLRAEEIETGADGNLIKGLEFR